MPEVHARAGEQHAAPRFIVVVGTDTGVGKTLVSTGLALALAQAGRSVVACKPIESGCEVTVSDTEDGVRLAQATGQAQPTHALVRLRDPITPALAAERDGVAIDVRSLARSIEALAGEAQAVLVEGAGGVLSPLAWHEGAVQDITHLAAALGGVVLLVASDRLGTLHHVLAAQRVLEQAKLPVMGLVLSAPAIADASTGTNLAMLRRLLPNLRSVALPRVKDPLEAAPLLAAAAAWIPRAPQ